MVICRGSFLFSRALFCISWAKKSPGAPVYFFSLHAMSYSLSKCFFQGVFLVLRNLFCFLSPNNKDYQHYLTCTCIYPYQFRVVTSHLARSIQDSETSIDFVQGPPGSCRERVKFWVKSSHLVSFWGSSRVQSVESCTNFNGNESRNTAQVTGNVLVHVHVCDSSLTRLQHCINYITFPNENLIPGDLKTSLLGHKLVTLY